jgi:hypothetical protein
MDKTMPKLNIKGNLSGFGFYEPGHLITLSPTVLKDDKLVLRKPNNLTELPDEYYEHGDCPMLFLGIEEGLPLAAQWRRFVNHDKLFRVYVLYNETVYYAVFRDLDFMRRCLVDAKRVVSRYKF